MNEDLRFLQAGAVFIKSAYNKTGTVAKRFVFVTKDDEKDKQKRGAVYWCKPGSRIENREKSLPLDEITTINFLTSNNHHNPSGGRSSKGPWAFSIVSSSRSLTLDAESEDQMNKWVGGLRLFLLVRVGIKETAPPPAVKLPPGYVLCSNGTIYDKSKQWKCIGKLVKKEDRNTLERPRSPLSITVPSASLPSVSPPQSPVSRSMSGYDMKDLSPRPSSAEPIKWKEVNRLQRTIDEKDRRIMELELQVRMLQQQLVQSNQSRLLKENENQGSGAGPPPKGTFSNSSYQQLDQEFVFVYKASSISVRCIKNVCQGVVRDGCCAIHGDNRKPLTLDQSDSVRERKDSVDGPQLKPSPARDVRPSLGVAIGGTLVIKSLKKKEQEKEKTKEKEEKGRDSDSKSGSSRSSNNNSHRKSADLELECECCLNEMTKENYCEYSMVKGGKWYSSKFCTSCVGDLLEKKWSLYVEEVQQADCQATLTRLLSAGPPVNLRDPVAFPLSAEDEASGGNGEVQMFWHEADNKEHAAKLEGSLTGVEREKWWNEHKVFGQEEGSSPKSGDKKPAEPVGGSRSQHGSAAGRELECSVCSEEISADTYCEYQYKKGGRWSESSLCTTCVEHLINTKWESYVEEVEHADCQATLTRLLELGPPINLRDSQAFPYSEGEEGANNGELYMLWYEHDKKEHPPKLKNSLTGTARMEWWEQHKIFAQKEEEVPSGVPKVASNLDGELLPRSVLSLSVMKSPSKRSSFLRKASAVNRRNGSVHGSSDTLEGLECVLCWNEISKGNRNYCEYQLTQGGKWFQAQFCTTCTERELNTRWTTFVQQVEGASSQTVLEKLLAHGPPINIKDSQGFPIPEGENSNVEVHLLWFEHENEERSAKLRDSLTGMERQRWWDEHKSFGKKKTRIEEKTVSPPSSAKMRSSAAFDMILNLEGNSVPEKVHRISQFDAPLQKSWAQT